MRRTLLSVGQLCCIFGLQILLVDKIVPHQFVPVPAQLLDPASGTSESGLRVIDLPDSGGYVLIVVGIVCLMYLVALGGKKGDGCAS
jgi:hypothetical protein